MYNIIGPESQNRGGVIGEIARPPRDISADGDVKRLFNNHYHSNCFEETMIILGKLDHSLFWPVASRSEFKRFIRLFPEMFRN